MIRVSRFEGADMADYYSVIAQAVSILPNKTEEARHAIYDRARTAIQEKLRTLDPPISEPEIERVRLELEAAIVRLEMEYIL